MQKSAAVIEQILLSLPQVSHEHRVGSSLYSLFNDLAAAHVEALFAGQSSSPQNFGPFGALSFPYRKMGAIDSLALFGLDELILFSFYWANRHRYKKVLDIGANIGLHSLIMTRVGFSVSSYEPDSTHFQWLKETMTLNNIETATLNNAAVSNREGEAEFVRVLGNTTSSHLAGSKDAYGELEKYKVHVADILKIIQDIDLIKMDVEGHEAEILLALQEPQYRRTDILVEIGSSANAERIYKHIESLNGINLFAQKKGWGLVEKFEDMPTSYKDGTLFITAKRQMFWS